MVCSDGQVENTSAWIGAFQDGSVRFRPRGFFFGFQLGIPAYVVVSCPVGTVNIDMTAVATWEPALTLIDDDGTRDERCLAGA